MHPPIESGGGVFSVHELHAQGISRHSVATAVKTGRLIRVKRTWVARPDADPMLVEAARTGSILSCITQARRLGLWVSSQSARQHVAVRAHHRRPQSDVVAHWNVPLLPRTPATLADGIENVLHLIASCQPFEDALATWESAVHLGLIDVAVLGNYRLNPPARRILAEMLPFSDSGLETLVRARLTGLGIAVTPQVWILGHRVDFLIDERLVFQVDGGTHVGAQRNSDNAHDIRLRLAGYHVFRAGYRQIIDEWPTVQLSIMRAIAQGLSRRAPRWKNASQ